MKKTKLITAIVFACLCVVMIIIAGTQLFKIDNSDIRVVDKIDVSSKVTNVLQQKYNSTLYGRVKNTTSKKVENITIIVNVKTNTLNHTGTLEVEISSINSGYEYQINKVFETTENFESVVSVKYRVNGATYDIPNGKEFNTVSLIFMALAVACVIVAVYLFKSTRDVVKVVQTPVQTHTKSREEVLEEIIAKQQENENKRIELEAKKVSLDTAKLDMENKKLENEKPLYCTYCGAKNHSGASKCCNCGGLLKK